MKSVWPGNWTPESPSQLHGAAWRHSGPILIKSLRTFPRVKSLRDLRFNASFHHITHSPAHNTPDDIQNSLGLLECIPKISQEIENNWLTNYLNKRNELLGLVTFYQHGHLGIKYIFSSFFGVFAQYKNAGQLQVYLEVRLEPFRTDATYFFFEYLFLKHGQWKESKCW